MGLYDRVHVYESIDLPEFDGDRTGVKWQTKDFGRTMTDYVIRADGRLYKADREYEKHETDEDEFAPFTLEQVDEKWVDMGYHGIFRFYRSVDDEWVEFEAKFTDGELVQITRESRKSRRDRPWLAQ